MAVHMTPEDRPVSYLHACGERVATTAGAYAHLLVCPLAPRRRVDPVEVAMIGLPPDRTTRPWSVLKRLA